MFTKKVSCHIEDFLRDRKTLNQAQQALKRSKHSDTINGYSLALYPNINSLVSLYYDITLYRIGLSKVFKVSKELLTFPNVKINQNRLIAFVDPNF